jgi:hypothetical protein
MRRIKTVNLQPSEKLPVLVCHESGVLLHAAGERLLPRHIAMLRTCGIDYVFEINNAAELARFREKTQYKAVRTSSLVEGSVLASAIFSSSKVLLLQANVQITAAIKDSLIKRCVGEIYIRKTSAELRTDEALYYLQKIGKLCREAKQGEFPLAAPEAERAEVPLEPDMGRFAPDAGVEPAKKQLPPSRGAAPLGTERRRHRRLSISIPVTVYLQRPHSSIWSDESIEAVAKNLSKGGICVMLSRDISDEKRMRIKIKYDRLKLMLDAVAEIVRFRHAGKQYEVGARYLAVGAERMP